LTSKDPSSIDKLLAKIIDNIQIKISNIYIRYEDAYSAPNQGTGKFVMGLLLKEFSTFTTGSDWKTVAMQLGEEITHKLATIKDFSLFLDYETSPDSSSSLPRELDLERLMKDQTNTVFMDILRNEFDNHANHHYIIEKFGM
jgi:vacuolar protein sorting-associated protein 13A/C